MEQLESRSGFKCKVHLTDFGTTLPLDERHVYEGTLRHGAGSVLSSLAKHGRLHPVVCSRETELESLVKMMYILEEKESTSLDGINPVAEGGCEKLKVWWEETEIEMGDRILSRFHSARNANYATLRNN